MKIVHVIDSFFPDSNAGTEQYVLWLSLFLSEKGHNVSIIAATTDESKKYIFKGIPVYRFQVPNKPTAKELNGHMPPRGIDNFIFLLRQLKPEIVHFHSFNRAINSYHLKLAKNQGYKTVFTAHLSNLFCIKGDFLLFGKEPCDGKVDELRCLQCYLTSFKRLQKKAILIRPASHLINKLLMGPTKYFTPSAWHLIKHRRNELSNLELYCDMNIAIASWIEDLYRINGISKVRLVKHAISDEIELKLNRQVKSVYLPINLIFVGRLHPMKGLHILLDALSEVDTSKFRLIIIGIPQDRDYQKKMEEKGKSINVDWKMNLPHANVLEEILNSDILVLPSLKNEMAPLVIMEAFANGKPVIGSSHPAITTMVNNNKDGLIFENNNVQSLKTCLQRLYEEPDLISLLAKNIIPPRSFTDVGNETLSLYKDLLT